MGYIDTDALYEALSKGTVSMDEFMDTIVELDENGADGIVSFQEQAQNSCDSIGTAITNVANRFKKGFATILTSMNEAAKNTEFGSVAGMINNFSNSIKNFLDKVGEAFKENEAFKTFMNQIANGLNKLNNEINSLSTEQLDNIVTAFVNMAKAGPILLAVGEGFKVVSSGFKGLSSGAKTLENITTKASGLSSSLSKLPSNVSNVASNIGNFTSGISSGLGLIFSEFTPKFSKFFSNIGQMFSTFGGKIGIFLSPVTTAFSSLGGKIGTFLSPVKTLLDKTAVSTGLFAQLVKFNVGETFNQIFPNFSSGISKISSSFGGLFEKITPLLQNFLPMFTKAFNITAIIGLLVAGLGLLQQNFGDKINEIAKIAIEQGPTIITNLINGIVTKIPELIAQGSQLIQTLLNVITANLPVIIQGGIEIISALVTGLANELPTLIPMALELILTLVTSLLDNVDQLIDAGIALIIGLAEGLINAIPILIEKTPVIIEKLLTALINNAPKLISAGWELIVKLVSGIIENFPKLLEAAGQIIEIIGGKLKELPRKALEWGKDMIQGFIDGIKNMLGSVGSAVSGVADKVKSFLHFSRPDEGPLRDYETWMPDMIRGLTKTLKQSSPKLYNASKDLAEKISNGLDIADLYNQMQMAVMIETEKISANLETTSNANRSITVNMKLQGNVDMDGSKVGRLVAPSVSKTLRTGGAY